MTNFATITPRDFFRCESAHGYPQWEGEDIDGAGLLTVGDVITRCANDGSPVALTMCQNRWLTPFGTWTHPDTVGRHAAPECAALDCEESAYAGEEYCDGHLDALDRADEMIAYGDDYDRREAGRWHYVD